LFVIFLSDGAPSDHVQMECMHGVKVFEQKYKKKEEEKEEKEPCEDCPTSRGCCSMLHALVRERCVEEVARLRDIFGSDRLYFGTLAFGPLSEQYRVLQEMGSKLPRGCFEKLGLSGKSLQTALATLSSTFTSILRTTSNLRQPLTLRQMPSAGANHRTETLTEGYIKALQGWDIYLTPDVKHKRRWDLTEDEWEEEPVPEGVAHAQRYHAQGAERLVFHCTEIAFTPGPHRLDTPYKRVGASLVSKQTKHEEYIEGHLAFLEKHCRCQALAEDLAQKFNTVVRIVGRMRKSALLDLSAQVHCVKFVDCHVFGVSAAGSEDGEITWFLVEDELEGRYLKWNDNRGGVKEPLKEIEAEATQQAEVVDLATARALVAEERKQQAMGRVSAADNLTRPVTADDVPQAFSHYTYYATDGRMLVCDIQGVYNRVDGFVLSDPVVHEVCGAGKRHKNGATDKGEEGIDMFFSSHVCNPLCARLSLLSHLPAPRMN